MKDKRTNQITRRGFLGSAALVTAAAAVAPSLVSCSGRKPDPYLNALRKADGKPNSLFNGVQIGTITYSFRGINGSDETIRACVEGNVSSIELMGQGLEEEIGAPSNPIRRGGFGRGPMPGGPPPGGPQQGGPQQGGPQQGGPQQGGPQQGGQQQGGPRQGTPPQGGPQPGGGMPGGMPRMQQPELTDEEKALQAKYVEDLAAFRNDPATLDKWAAMGKKFRDAGINIHIFKWTAGNTDELLDYSFKAARALGAKAICTEIGEESCKTLGAAAERNGMLAVFHNHGQYASMTVSEIEKWLAYSPANRLNFDCGHFFGYGFDYIGLDPIQFIDHFSSKILSIHLKDKTSLENEFASNQNQVWGQGETPLREILQHVRDNYPGIHCDIELEYNFPQWSNSAMEVAKCVRYAREALI